MFCQPINVNPEKETDEFCVDHVNSNKDFLLVLAPFQPQTRIIMEIFLNIESTTTSFLHIKNTGDHTLNVNIIKKPPPERFINLSFTSAVIEAKSTAVLKITWSPKETGTWWDVLQLTVNNREKYEISLVTSAKDPHKTYNEPKTSEIFPTNVPQCYLPKKYFIREKESSLHNKNIQSRCKRSRMDPFLEEFNKENKTNNIGLFSETSFKKPRKETFDTFHASTTFTPVNFNSESKRKIPEARVLGFNIPSQKKDLEIKNLKRETYIVPPKYRENLIKIDKNESTDINCNVNFNPAKETCTFLPFPPIGNETNFIKPTRLVRNFDLSTPAPKNKIEFAPSSLIAMSSISETPKRFSNNFPLDLGLNTAKGFFKADFWVKPKNIPMREITEKVPEKKTEEKKISPPKQKAGKVKKISPTLNGKVRHFRKSIKNFSVPVCLGMSKRKGNQALKTRKDHVPNFANTSNPDPFAATTTEDPFLSGSLNDENWILLQELEFKKWLNALMTPSEDFNTETTSVDIGKIWQSTRMKEDVLLESLESISARYHTNTRLNTLRKAACKMFRSDEVKNNLLGAMKCVENKRLDIKKDKDLNRDIGLQKEILELFLSYNPLWLRIGLETIYGEMIPLKSNNDLVGLTRFLLARFFSDPSIVKEHSHPTVVNMRRPTFTPNLNDFMLKKFLQLVYFLDYAKMNKLIGHDPCLFRKKAPHKESRSILLTFSSEVLSGIGDVTKVLRRCGYVLKHKQSFLEEFDYAVHDVSSDLRDGVRLCRAMELISGNRNLTIQCSVPANSRVQKVHNVRIALKALLDSGYVLTGKIDARSVAEGHREKTLSLLWQIIYKFQAPRFEKAALRLQSWWRSKLWYVRLRNLLKKRRSDAAFVIQRNWRFYLARKKLNRRREDLELREKAARIIQKRWILRRKERSKDKSVLKIQRWWRRIRETRHSVENLRRKLETVILVQKVWRAKKLMQKERSEFLELKEVCAKIQIRWRAKLAGNLKRTEFIKMKKAAIFIQRKWRSLKLMKQERESYKRILIASRVIQKWWKGLLILKKDRNNFLSLKNAVRIFEKSWIEKKTILEERKQFLEKRRNAIVIQRFWRRYSATRKEVLQFRICRRSSVTIQSWWKSILIRREYKIKKKSSLVIQKWWRSLQETKTCQTEYQRTRNAILVIQKNWRMLKARNNHQKMRSASVNIQSWFRMKVQKRKFETYLKRHKAAIVIQRRWRATLAERKAAVKIQNWWRSVLIMRGCRNNYLQLKNSVIRLQRRYRAKVLGKEIRTKYEDLRKEILKIQAYWLTILVRRKFKLLFRRKKAVIVIENWWKDVLKKKQIEEERAKELRRIEEAATKIQAAFRGYKVRQAESSRMAEMRKRTENATSKAMPAKTLANRLRDSIDVFIVSNDLGRLSMCLASLDLITRLSNKSCIIVCKVGLVDKIFETLVRSNRSLPWMDACLRATSTLVNLAKYPPTKSFVLKQKYIETLARLLTVTVEKEVQLFLHLATLMWVLVEDPHFARAVLKNSCSAWLLNSLYDKVNRKKKKFGKFNPKGKKEIMPNLKPDWGLKQKQPRLFSNVLQAVNSVKRRLDEYQE